MGLWLSQQIVATLWETIRDFLGLIIHFEVVTDPFVGIRVGYQVNGSDITVSEPGSSGSREWGAPIYDEGR
jgi:hypothetical protein